MYDSFKKLCEATHQDVGEDYGSNPGLITFGLLTDAWELKNTEYPGYLEQELDRALKSKDCSTLADICERQAEYYLVMRSTSLSDVISIQVAVQHFRNLSKHREVKPGDFDRHRNELKKIIKAATDDKS